MTLHDRKQQWANHNFLLHQCQAVLSRQGSRGMQDVLMLPGCQNRLWLAFALTHGALCKNVLCAIWSLLESTTRWFPHDRLVHSRTGLRRPCSHAGKEKMDNGLKIATLLQYFCYLPHTNIMFKTQYWIMIIFLYFDNKTHTDLFLFVKVTQLSSSFYAQNWII
jgi:hypothetical protein